MRTQQQKGSCCVSLKTAVRLQRTKLFSEFGVKEISRAIGVLLVFFCLRCKGLKVCFCHANNQQ